MSRARVSLGRRRFLGRVGTWHEPARRPRERPGPVGAGRQGRPRPCLPLPAPGRDRALQLHEPAGYFNIEWRRFTLDNWKAPFADRALTEALEVSLKIAAVSTLVSTALGSLMAIALSRYEPRGARFFELLLVLPLATPEIVLGSALATLFLRHTLLDFGPVTIVIAHVMLQLSFVAVVVRARVRDFDWTLEQAAWDLGAPPLQTFWTVTFPLILPGILGAALLSFAVSIDDFIVTFFNAGSTVTFPLQVFGASRARIPPQVHVLATAILLASVALLLLGTAVGGRRRHGHVSR